MCSWQLGLRTFPAAALWLLPFSHRNAFVITVKWVQSQIQQLIDDKIWTVLAWRALLNHDCWSQHLIWSPTCLWIVLKRIIERQRTCYKSCVLITVGAALEVMTYATQFLRDIFSTAHEKWRFIFVKAPLHKLLKLKLKWEKINLDKTTLSRNVLTQKFCFSRGESSQ